MDDPLAGAEKQGLPNGRLSQTTSVPDAIEHTDIDETARDADIMMRMIVGSISPDPDDIQRGLKKNKRPLPPAPLNAVNSRLVVLAAALVALVFALDLVFLKM